jgi:CubicO group peptidase (beta-lactamase class C family)
VARAGGPAVSAAPALARTGDQAMALAPALAPAVASALAPALGQALRQALAVALGLGRALAVSLALTLAAATACRGGAAAPGATGQGLDGTGAPEAKEAALGERAGELGERFTIGLQPGCALAVVENGQVALARGYGFADLARRAPITPRTVFDVASVSKQFTAASVLLLAGHRRLALDDDVRKYVPELARLGTGGTGGEAGAWGTGGARAGGAGMTGGAETAGGPGTIAGAGTTGGAGTMGGAGEPGAAITLRQLLHHTGGLPSYIDLLVSSGRRYEEVTGDGEALAALAGVRQTLFRPGTAFRYSDTGYFLLSLVVRRVSGQSLRQFAAENLFAPLGMTDTCIVDQAEQQVPRRAVAYSRAAGGGFQPVEANWEQTGDGGVNTTVLDLARWDANFYSGTVGGKALVTAMTTPGTDTSGRPLPYGGGLFLDQFRGFQRVRHPGSWRGWSAELMRLPERRLSVVALCNRDDANPTALAEEMAEAALAEGR